MSAKDAARIVKERFGRLDSPPARDEVKGYLGDVLSKGRPGRKRKAEKMTQLNFCACPRS
jgi:hypothetical protein